MLKWGLELVLLWALNLGMPSTSRDDSKDINQEESDEKRRNSAEENEDSEVTSRDTPEWALRDDEAEFRPFHLLGYLQPIINQLTIEIHSDPDESPSDYEEPTLDDILPTEEDYTSSDIISPHDETENPDHLGNGNIQLEENTNTKEDEEEEKEEMQEDEPQLPSIPE